MRSFKPSPAMAVALLALVFSMAGTGLAARYVITSSKQIKNGAVSGADVKNSSLTGSDIKNKSVTGSDVKDGSLSANDFGGALPAGGTGPQGPQGVPGPKGEPGPTVIGRGVYDNAPPAISTAGEKTLLTLGLATGGFIVNAKVTLENTSPDGVIVDCFLRAGNAYDESRAEIAGTGLQEGTSTMTLPFTLATAFSPGEDTKVKLTCNGFGIPLTPTNAKITGVSVPVYTFDAY